MSRKKISFELRNTALSLITLALKSTDLDLIQDELTSQFGVQSDYFDNEPAILDLAAIEAQEVDLSLLLSLLGHYQLHPFAVANACAAQQEKAKQAGLIVLSQEITHHTPNTDKKTPAQTCIPPLIVDKPLRSGQQVYARDTDLIITSLVNFGAEVIADGNIHVYAPLRGRAIAGAQGNTSARIFSTCFEPALYAIAGIFQTTEQQLPDNILGKPTMVYLENEILIATPLYSQSP